MSSYERNWCSLVELGLKPFQNRCFSKYSFSRKKNVSKKKTNLNTFFFSTVFLQKVILFSFVNHTFIASENANETIAYKLHKSPKKLKTEILKNIAENDNKINKSSPVPTKRYSLLPPSLPSGVHNTPESKSYVNQNEIILEKISGSSSQSTENHTIETLTTASSDNPHNSMDETQMISNQVYISELQNDARNEIFRHETLIKQTSHLIAATENSKNNNNTGSLKPPGNSKSSDSKSENNYDIESEERIVEANRLLLISNEEIERLNSRIQNLNSDDYREVFSDRI